MQFYASGGRVLVKSDKDRLKYPMIPLCPSDSSFLTSVSLLTFLLSFRQCPKILCLPESFVVYRLPSTLQRIMLAY